MLCALDTNSCIDLLRGRSKRLAGRVLELTPAQVCVPSLVYAELLLAAELSADPPHNRRFVDQLVAPLRMLSFDPAAATVYASIRAHLQASGQLIGPNDLIIAATAVAHHALLVSANVREFRRVPGLRVEDWTQ
ncbi:MAG: type II toxin-antitoxin system VapC family toxin [Lentisphaerae bacterium]|nr:type II toxin-antitoxin system VapC family toxin [Lentisphaerota bacterium]